MRTACLLLAFVVFASSCRVCSYRTFEVQVRDADTGDPVEHAHVAEVSGGWRPMFTFLQIGCPSHEQVPPWYRTDEHGSTRIRLPAHERPLIAVVEPGVDVPVLTRAQFRWTGVNTEWDLYTVPDITETGWGAHEFAKHVPRGRATELHKAPPWSTPHGEHDPPLPYVVTVIRR